MRFRKLSGCQSINIRITVLNKLFLRNLYAVLGLVVRFWLDFHSQLQRACNTEGFLSENSTGRYSYLSHLFRNDEKWPKVPETNSPQYQSDASWWSGVLELHKIYLTFKVRILWRWSHLTRFRLGGGEEGSVFDKYTDTLTLSNFSS